MTFDTFNFNCVSTNAQSSDPEGLYSQQITSPWLLTPIWHVGCPWVVVGGTKQ